MRKGAFRSPISNPSANKLAEEQMTKIRMDWKNLKLEMTGHAGSAPAGQDLVCCAESILSQTLIGVLADMAEDADMDWTGTPEQGYMMIEADPRKGHEAEVQSYFRFAVKGLRMLAEAYPQNVEIREDR